MSAMGGADRDVRSLVRLVDRGDGRRLDRLGPYLVDRPAPAADRLTKADPLAWDTADARYERAPGRAGRWDPADIPGERWEAVVEGLVLELRLTETGGVGLFPEQVPMWRWAHRRLASHSPRTEPPALLNLFAHTGGLTLAAARAGAAVVHVDASRTAVAWARRNAELSGLDDAPIRWIVDDVEAFVRRELRRGRRYDAVALDPPSYGHGPRGEPWRLEDRLSDLLAASIAVTTGRRTLVLVTAHTPGVDGERLGRELAAVLPPEERGRGLLETGALEERAVAGGVLPGGAFARWGAR